MPDQPRADRIPLRLVHPDEPAPPDAFAAPKFVFSSGPAARPLPHPAPDAGLTDEDVKR